MSGTFAVKSNSFETYEHFKIKLENIGYKYLHTFNIFKEDRMASNDCLYVARNWNDKNDYLFSFSNANDEINSFDIDHELAYREALKFAKLLFANRQKITVTLSDIACWKKCNPEDICITI
jgi:hypothetical protein